MKTAMKTVIFSGENMQRFIFKNKGMTDADFNFMLQSFISGITTINGIYANALFYIRTMDDYAYFGMFYDETQKCYFVSKDYDSYEYISDDSTKPIEFIRVRGLYQSDANSRLIVVDVKYTNNIIIN